MVNIIYKYFKHSAHDLNRGLIKILLGIVGLYIVLCGVLYFFQEKIIFFPQKLDKDYAYTFGQDFEEIDIRTKDGLMLNGLLFKTNNPKGLIFYLHGNAGNLNSWGNVASVYTAWGYDVFMLDYRGYGKSEGKIISQKQVFEDNQIAYNQLKRRYSEKDMVILGYSIGTGFASQLAASNQARLLILQAPYYSLVDMMEHNYPFIPTFLLRYPLKTYQYVADCSAPVVVFHGTEDEVIYYDSSIKLKTKFKPADTLITLQGQGHNGMTDNPMYQTTLRKILLQK